jgi:hypothetical protein
MILKKKYRAVVLCMMSSCEAIAVVVFAQTAQLIMDPLLDLHNEALILLAKGRCRWSNAKRSCNSEVRQADAASAVRL